MTNDQLEKLFHLNHWAKTRDIMTRRDRDVLYDIKREQVQELFDQQLLTATGCMTRPNTTLRQLHSERWDGLPLDSILECAGDNELDLTTESLVEQLDEIYKRAVESCQVLDTKALDELHVPPNSFAVEERHWHVPYGCGWSDVQDVTDPCWYWLVEFQTQAPLPRFSFHLPYRVAASFVAIDGLIPSDSGQEFGEVFGRPITEQESLAFPILELVQFFGRSAKDFPNRLQTRDEIESEITARDARSADRNDAESDFPSCPQCQSEVHTSFANDPTKWKCAECGEVFRDDE